MYAWQFPDHGCILHKRPGQSKTCNKWQVYLTVYILFAKELFREYFLIIAKNIFITVLLFCMTWRMMDKKRGCHYGCWNYRLVSKTVTGRQKDRVRSCRCPFWQVGSTVQAHRTQCRCTSTREVMQRLFLYAKMPFICDFKPFWVKGAWYTPRPL